MASRALSPLLGSDMASHQLTNGYQAISLTSDDSDSEQEVAQPTMIATDRAHARSNPLPAITPVTRPALGISHRQFCENTLGETLPGDNTGRGSFDALPTFVIGDPAAKFDAQTVLEYETTEEVGHPIWSTIFHRILLKCDYLLQYDTVYVMVDTRNLAAHQATQDGLPHWPAAVAWWHSRLQLIGPRKERTELLFFPANEHTGLHLVRPTWAGTFVLAALVAAFPGIHFILLDSDCLPVTLFEVADLWSEAYVARFPPGSGKSIPLQHLLQRQQRYIQDSQVVYTPHRVDSCRIGQGILLVTEPRSELNAGFIVAFASSHPPLFDWKELEGMEAPL